MFQASKQLAFQSAPAALHECCTDLSDGGRPAVPCHHAGYIRARPVVHQLETVRPQKRARDTDSGRRGGKFVAAYCSLSHLLDPSFLDRHVRSDGCLTAVMHEAACDRGNVAFIADGRLHLFVDVDTYKTLGLQGTNVYTGTVPPSAAKAAVEGSADRRWICIDLRPTGFRPGDAEYDRVVWCVGAERIPACTWLLSYQRRDGGFGEVELPESCRVVCHDAAVEDVHLACGTVPDVAAALTAAISTTRMTPRADGGDTDGLGADVGAGAGSTSAACDDLGDAHAAIAAISAWFGAITNRLFSPVVDGSSVPMEQQRSQRRAAGLLDVDDVVSGAVDVGNGTDVVQCCRTRGLLSSTSVLSAVRKAQVRVCSTCL